MRHSCYCFSMKTRELPKDFRIKFRRASINLGVPTKMLERFETVLLDGYESKVASIRGFIFDPIETEKHDFAMDVLYDGGPHAYASYYSIFDLSGEYKFGDAYLKFYIFERPTVHHESGKDFLKPLIRKALTHYIRNNPQRVGVFCPQGGISEEAGFELSKSVKDFWVNLGFKNLDESHWLYYWCENGDELLPSQRKLARNPIVGQENYTS